MRHQFQPVLPQRRVMTAVVSDFVKYSALQQIGRRDDLVAVRGPAHLLPRQPIADLGIGREQQNLSAGRQLDRQYQARIVGRRIPGSMRIGWHCRASPRRCGANSDPDHPCRCQGRNSDAARTRRSRRACSELRLPADHAARGYRLGRTGTIYRFRLLRRCRPAPRRRKTHCDPRHLPPGDRPRWSRTSFSAMPRRAADPGHRSARREGRGSTTAYLPASSIGHARRYDRPRREHYPSPEPWRRDAFVPRLHLSRLRPFPEPARFARACSRSSGPRPKNVINSATPSAIAFVAGAITRLLDRNRPTIAASWLTCAALALFSFWPSGSSGSSVQANHTSPTCSCPSLGCWSLPQNKVFNPAKAATWS